MFPLLVGGAVLYLVVRAARGARPGSLDGYVPTAADRDGWVQLQDGPGLVVRSQAHAWTTPAVARVMAVAGEAAQALGGALQIADVGQKKRGVPFEPHLSHRWGADLDVGYTFDGYPTPADAPVDPRVVEAIGAIAPFVEKVGVNASRRSAFDGAPFKVSVWDGHVGHLHLRLRPDLTAEPRGRRLLPEIVEAEYP